MAVRKKPVRFYLIMAVFVSSIIFMSGVGIGIVIDNLKGDNLNTNINKLNNYLQDAEIELMVMDYLGGNYSCNYLMLKSSQLIDVSAELGEKLDIFEQSNQVNPESYTHLKEEYMRVLIKNWVTLEKIKNSCSSNYTTILYFYNNINCPKCSNQAYVLQYFKQNLKENVMIFAIDSGLELSIVELLIYNFEVTEYPSLVINGEIYSGYQDASVLNELLTKI